MKSNNATSAIRDLRAIGLAVTAAIALAGCVSDGASSFSNVLDVRTDAQKQTQSAQPLPLDVAGTGVIDATGQPIAQSTPIPGPTTSPTLPPANSIAERSLVAEQARQLASLEPTPPAALSTTQPEPASAIALLPANETAIPAMSLPASPQMTDPLEIEAAARAEAQYAAMKHGECKGGWGPKPKMINAKRIDPAHQYYMEMRLRHTPPLPVGHVYIAYGRIGPDGEPLDEKLVMLAPIGGYAGATVAAAAPVTGVLTPYGDYCILRPIAAYRISLSAQNYEKLLQRIVQAQGDKPRYALWTYNCNHFMSDVAASVGILPPENKYKPSLEYFYQMMDRNEGRKVARSPAAEEAELADAKFGSSNQN